MDTIHIGTWDDLKLFGVQALTGGVCVLDASLV